MKISTLTAWWTCRLEQSILAKCQNDLAVAMVELIKTWFVPWVPSFFVQTFFQLLLLQIVQHLSISCHLFLQLLYFIFINLILVCPRLNYSLVEWVPFSASTRTRIPVVIQCCCLLGGSLLFFNLLWLYNSVFDGMVFVWCCCVCKKVSNSTICYCGIWSLCTICQYSQLGPSIWYSM
jgi:hypothetical protein